LFLTFSSYFATRSYKKLQEATKRATSLQLTPATASETGAIKLASIATKPGKTAGQNTGQTIDKTTVT
jgi:hypothetical protein